MVREAIEAADDALTSQRDRLSQNTDEILLPGQSILLAQTPGARTVARVPRLPVLLTEGPPIADSSLTTLALHETLFQFEIGLRTKDVLEIVEWILARVWPFVDVYHPALRTWPPSKMPRHRIVFAPSTHPNEKLGMTVSPQRIEVYIENYHLHDWKGAYMPELSLIRNENDAVEVWGRLLGETICHEIAHWIFGGQTHRIGAKNNDLLREGASRSFHDRTAARIKGTELSFASRHKIARLSKETTLEAEAALEPWRSAGRPMTKG